MLVRADALMRQAQEQGRVVGAFNILSLEMIRGVLIAAEKTKSAVILQVSSSALKWANFNLLVPALLNGAKQCKMPVAVHLDHCQDLNLLKNCIDAGFSSVMYDGSHLSYQKNIQNSLIAKQFAKNKASLEIEIGQIGGKEDELIIDKSSELKIEQIIDFYQQTHPDLLAIAFGTVHGKYHGKINLNYDLIKKVHKKLEVPLVMHGTSGIPKKMIEKAIRSGISKINVGTNLLIAYFDSMREYMQENPQAYDWRKINQVGIEAIVTKTIQYINIFNNR